VDLKGLAEGRDSALQHKSLFRIINITSPKSNPTSAPTFYSRVTDAVWWPRSPFDWRGRGCLRRTNLIVNDTPVVQLDKLYLSCINI
jgi:hypothetical protein